MESGTDDGRGRGGSFMDSGLSASDSEVEGTIDESSPFSPENSTCLVQHDVGPHDVFVGQGEWTVRAPTR